ncbi:solute carrier family 13 member 2-like [Branchiostoma lanceolatum]|uniref:solute carrier family 13 member 2-like n=1 Tax=Branchiostoma lanceolatum TaxID=7740 RepID=UPI00345172AB
MAMGCRDTLRELLSFKTSVVFWLVPIAACPLPITYAWTEFYMPAACAYVIIIMAAYWMFEVVPLAVTALLPMILFPVMGIQPSSEVCLNYLKDNSVLLLGGLLVAIAVEKCNLHTRIALRILLLVGSELQWVMFGFMGATGLLSMWISNTAAAAMMTPIGQAVLDQLFREERRQQREEESDDECSPLIITDEDIENNHHVVSSPTLKNSYQSMLTADEPVIDFTVQPQDEALLSVDLETDSKPVGTEGETARQLKMRKAMLLCVAYAANIGGIATLPGTPTNIIVAEQVQIAFPDSPGIDFATWFFFGFPVSILCLLLAWSWLIIIFLGCGVWCRAEKNHGAQRVIRKAYSDLGNMTFAEKAVLFHFVLLVLLWFFRDLSFVKLENGRVAGWTYFFRKKYVTDSTPAVIVSFALFFFPSKPPRFLCCKRESDRARPGPVPALLDWRSVHDKMPWNVLLLLGGGFALADGVGVSGLSTSLAEQFTRLEGVPGWAICVLVCVFIALFTEVASNTASASIFLPILAKMAEALCVNPYFLMVPAGIAASFAFMLPVATPPNAIVFGYGKLTVPDMAKAGLAMNISCLLVLLIFINTLGIPVYNVNSFPEWVPSWPVCNASNITIPNTTATAMITF